jgi:hypothetical protein
MLGCFGFSVVVGSLWFLSFFLFFFLVAYFFYRISLLTYIYKIPPTREMSMRPRRVLDLVACWWKSGRSMNTTT